MGSLQITGRYGRGGGQRSGRVQAGRAARPLRCQRLVTMPPNAVHSNAGTGYSSADPTLFVDGRVTSRLYAVVSGQ